MSFEICLFFALAFILCSGAERLSNFGRGPPKEQCKMCWNLPSSYGGDVVWIFFSIARCVEIRPVVMVEMFFEIFFLFLALIAVLYSGEEYFEQFGRGPPKGLSSQVWLKSTLWLQRRFCLKMFFLFLALCPILCSGAEKFELFWWRTSKGTILSSLVKSAQ